MTRSERPPPLGLIEQILLLWRLRWSLARGAFGRGLAIIPSAGGLLSVASVTLVAASGTYAVFTSPGVLSDATLTRFLLLLLGFLASTLWITWPVVTATVDDASELSRFALFPVPPQRLFLASVLAGIVELRMLPVWGALLGAIAGLHESVGGRLAAPLIASAMLALCSVVWGRVGLHVLLNVLRHRRSAEAMGGGLLVLLTCSAFVPPPDLSWLRGLSAVEPHLDDALIEGATQLFTVLPTGGWGWAVFGGAIRRPWIGRIALAYMGIATVVGYVVAYRLLVRFHRWAGRALPQRPPDSAPVHYRSKTVTGLLIERELRDWVLNPRARLMIAVPFFLVILLKLVGARAFALELLGESADATLLGGVASYGALVLGAGFAQNAFGYDGGGAQLLLGGPIDAALIIRAKNIVHGGIAFVVALTLVAFYSAYIAWPGTQVIVLALLNAAYQVFLLVAAGNLMTVTLPRRFHASLKRRDRAPPLATVFGLVTASIAVAPAAALLRSPLTPGISLGLFVALPVAGSVLWRASIPLACELLRTRRPELLRSIARA